MRWVGGKSSSGLEICGFTFAVVTLATISVLKCQKMTQSVAFLRPSASQRFWLCKVSVDQCRGLPGRVRVLAIPVCPAIVSPETSFCSGRASAKLTCFVQVTPDPAPQVTCGTGAVPVGLCPGECCSGSAPSVLESPGVSRVVTKRIEDTVAALS